MGKSNLERKIAIFLRNDLNLASQILNRIAIFAIKSQISKVKSQIESQIALQCMVIIARAQQEQSI